MIRTLFSSSKHLLHRNNHKSFRECHLLLLYLHLLDNHSKIMLLLRQEEKSLKLLNLKLIC